MPLAADDRHEIGGLEACSADERAVDVGNGENFGRIRAFDRAAVKDSDLSARLAERGDQPARSAACMSPISAFVGTLPVPIAQIGS